MKITNFLKRLGIIIFIIFQSCGSDEVVKINEGYFYRNEGDKIKDILCSNPEGKEIPSTVISYAFDKNFIIAKQKPRTNADPLYKKVPYYKKGVNTFYFWIILQKKNIIFGPLSAQEFRSLRKKYKIPKDLELE